MKSRVVPEIKNLHSEKDFAENPFPGLRAFGVKESYLYFGREGQSEEVLRILSDHKFVTILGSSGTGKSSLMFSGVIPTLYGGYFSEKSAAWEVIAARPGLNPLENLAKSFAEYAAANAQDKGDYRFFLSLFNALINKSTRGICHIYDSLKSLENKNLLLYIDQFEEIFRFQNQGELRFQNESLAYVNKIVETINSSDYPIYIALSMRSDFLGECEKYPGLTNKINESHFLIPQMTREQKKLVIEGPVAVGGGKISTRLTQRLLNDMGDRPDQLPVLQHALMRSWDYWVKNRKNSEDTIDFIHYEAIGTVNEALSRHADEAFFELNEDQQILCETLFKTITEKLSEGDGIRRPTRLEEIAAVADVDVEVLKPIIDKFREKGRALLMPPAEVPLSPNSIIDISHEALMRVWYKLKEWVEEESASAKMYLQLSDAAQQYQEGIGAFLRPPDLQVAVEWRNKNQPILRWALQYAPNFEAAISYLKMSEESYNVELENREKLQKRRLRRSQLVASVLGLAMTISLVVLVFAFYQKQQADKQRIQALLNEDLAQKSAIEAQESKIFAQEQSLLANISGQRALRQKKIAEQNADEAERARSEAEFSKTLAERKSMEAEYSRLMTEQQKDTALLQRRRAEMSEGNFKKLRMISIAKSLALKSIQIDDKELQTIIAVLAYKLNTENGGYSFDNDIYNGLFKALKSMNADHFEAFNSKMSDVRSTALGGNQFLFSTGNEGMIYEWDIKNKNPERKNLVSAAPSYFKKINTSQRGNIIAGITAGNKVISYSRESKKVSEKTVPADHLYHLEVVNENELFVSASDNKIYKLDGAGKMQPFIEVPGKVFSFKYFAKKKRLFVATEDGKVQVWSAETGKFIKTLFDNPGIIIHSLAFSEATNKIAIGDHIGNLMVMGFNNELNKEIEYQLVGHNNRIITELIFNEPLNQLISSSTDGTVRIWNLGEPDRFPIVINESNNWVKSISVDNYNSRIYAGCRDRVFRAYPLSSNELVKDLYPFLKRDISPEEWKRYIGIDVPFESLMDFQTSKN